jgi:hydroxypyruvate isomerase
MGVAALPGREREFRDGVGRALDYATQLGCPLVHAASGRVPAGADLAHCRATYLENLAFACERAAGCGVNVGIEPVCRHARPDYFLQSTGEAEAILRELARPNLRLIVDSHHAAMQDGALAPVLERLHRDIALFQVANPPDRRPPGGGELDFDFLFDTLERVGYDGWVSAEYRPSPDTLSSLAWARRFGVAVPGRDRPRDAA